MVGGSLYYYHDQVRRANQRLTETKVFLRRLSVDTPRTPLSTEQTAEQLTEETTLQNGVSEDAFQENQVEFTASVDDIAEVHFAEETIEFQQTDPENDPSSVDVIPKTEAELKKLVVQKLREEGIRVRSASMKNGLVYPMIENVIYVEWAEGPGRNGRMVKYISFSWGGRDDVELLNAVHRERGADFSERDVPSHLILIPYDEGGIDPHQFLNGDR